MNLEKAQIQQHANDQKGKTFFAHIARLLYIFGQKFSKHATRILFASPLRTLFWLLICLALALFIPASKSLFQLDYPYTLRVVSPQNQRVFASLSPFGVGFEYDLVHFFASDAGYAVQWLHENDPTAAMAMLENNKADLAVGFPEIDQTKAHHPAIASNPAIASSPAHTHRASVAIQLDDASLEKYKAESEAQETAEDQSDGPSTSANLYAEQLYNGESIITDETSWSLWQPFAQGAGIASPIEHSTNYRWYWNKHNDKLGAQVLQFWYDRNQLDDTVLADLNEQYFNFIPTELDEQELAHLHNVVKTRLPRYQKYIDAAAKRYHIDPLLLTAVIFQESHFDPNAISYTGVRGIMQLTKSTADSLGVDRLNPEQSIDGGARYLRQIWDSLVDVGMGDEHLNDVAHDSVGPHAAMNSNLVGLSNWNRWCFTLAAFNQGRGHLRDAIRLSKELGGTGLTWNELKHIYPLMAQKQFYSKLRYGRCRGGEAVQFVDNIRWYYYILSGSAFLNRSKG